MINAIKKLLSGDLDENGRIIFDKASGNGVRVDKRDPGFGWVDWIGILRPDPGGANSPTLGAVQGGLCREYFYTTNDKMDMDFHVPHDYPLNTDVFIHIHWGHNGTAISGDLVVDFTHSYSKGHNQAIFSAEKTITMTYPTVDISATPRFIHRIDEVQLSTPGGSSTLLDTALIEPDGIILLNMTVTTIPTIVGGSVAKPFICFSDMHARSTGISTKQKAPDFYT